MKKIVLLTILMVISFVSCDEDKKKEVKKEDSFFFSGKINNFRKRSLTLKGYNFQEKIKFDRKTKTFGDTLRKFKPGHYTLVVGKRPVPLYLTSVDDLKIVLDAKKRTQAPTFTGNNANINNYLNNRRDKFGVILGSYKKFFAEDETSFLEKNKKYKAALLKLAESSNLPADYLKKEKRNIEYESSRNLYNYQRLHRILIGDEEFKTSKDLKKIIDNIDFNNAEDYVNFHQYRSLLKEHLNSVAEQKTLENRDFYLTYIETIQTEVTDTLVKNDLIHIISENALTYTTNLKEFYKKYMGYSTSAKNKREITGLYNKLKLTAKGMPSPKFKDYINYNGERTSLDDLIGKGKYLYIDLWATWCSFCKKEVPLLKNFEIKYHDKNIEFVSINVDVKSNFNKWKKTIEDKEMGGVQLFAGESHLKLKFAQDYLIKGLPRFIILDPEGKIVTANAPRPSDGQKLHEIFKELGIE